MPGSIPKVERLNNPSNSDSTPIPAEQMPLFLPSELTDEELAMGTAGLVDIENCLRDAQCRSALDSLRNQLHIKSRLTTYKDRNVRHQKPSTRSRSLLGDDDSKIRLHASKYRNARHALIKLARGAESLVEWPALDDDDLRCMEDPQDKEEQQRREEEKEARARGAGRMRMADRIVGPGPGESRREISWIWMATGASTEELHEGMSRYECQIGLCSLPVDSSGAHRMEQSMEPITEMGRGKDVGSRGDAPCPGVS